MVFHICNNISECMLLTCLGLLHAESYTPERKSKIDLFCCLLHKARKNRCIIVTQTSLLFFTPALIFLRKKTYYL